MKCFKKKLMLNIQYYSYCINLNIFIQIQYNYEYSTIIFVPYCLVRNIKLIYLILTCSILNNQGTNENKDNHTSINKLIY